MTRGLALAAAVGLLLALGACGTDGFGPENPNNWSETNVKLQDGRTIHCLMYGSLHGGPSCDWANAK